MIHKYIQIGFFIQEQAIGFQNNIVYLFVGTGSTPVNGSFNRDVFMLSRKSTILMMSGPPRAGSTRRLLCHESVLLLMKFRKERMLPRHCFVPMPIQACERCSLENRVASHSGLPNFVLPYPTMERRKHHGTQAGLLKPTYKIAKLLKGCNFSYVTEIKTPQR